MGFWDFITGKIGAAYRCYSHIHVRKYRKTPGATNVYLEKGATGRFVAFIGTLVSSAFPFTFAPELLVVTGGEMQVRLFSILRSNCK